MLSDLLSLCLLICLGSVSTGRCVFWILFYTNKNLLTTTELILWTNNLLCTIIFDKIFIGIQPSTCLKPRNSLSFVAGSSPLKLKSIVHRNNQNEKKVNSINKYRSSYNFSVKRLYQWVSLNCC